MSRNNVVLKTFSTGIFNELNQVASGHKSINIDGIKFNYFPQKVKTFSKNCKCLACGVEGTEVRIEYQEGCYSSIYGKPHLNLYAKYGMYEVLMTVDHNVLASEGGADLEENFNTLCTKCNQMRGNKYKSIDAFLKAVQGRDLLQEYMVSYFTPREKLSEEERRKIHAEQEFWNSDHLWHYRAYLKFLKKEEKKRKRQK